MLVSQLYFKAAFILHASLSVDGQPSKFIDKHFDRLLN